MKTNFDSKQQRSGLTNALTSRRLEQTKDQPLRSLFIVSIASEFAWSAQRFLRAYGLPDDVSVSATWRTQEDLPSLAGISLTVTVSRRAEAVGAALGAAFENSLAARSLAEPVVHISFEGVNR
jgi:hypothetical protein